MPEVTVVELTTQVVLGIRKKGSYREIPLMFSRIFDFALNKNIQIAG
jgi:AraC family transcriptional regulator